MESILQLLDTGTLLVKVPLEFCSILGCFLQDTNFARRRASGLDLGQQYAGGCRCC